ncbi:MAG: DUF2953 domain-containing protein [Oscillospiraceae bacterium]|nr:DUF2953 domain-containing protein [Oscillospiraceae bacterium]
MIILNILKIIALIILALIGFLIFLMILPVSVRLEYIGEKFYYEVRYSFLSVISSDAEKGIAGMLKRRKKKKIPVLETVPETDNKLSEVENESAPETQSVTDLPEDKPEEISSEKIPEPEKSPKKSKVPKTEKRSLSDISELWDKITQIWEILSSPAKRLCREIHFDKIFIDFKISDPDAYDCAINYGKTCIILYNMLGIFNQIFSLSKKSINVECVFNKEKSIYDISFTVRFHPIVALLCGGSFLWTYYFKIYRKQSGGNRKNGKQRNKNRKANK